MKIDNMIQSLQLSIIKLKLEKGDTKKEIQRLQQKVDKLINQKKESNETP